MDYRLSQLLQSSKLLPLSRSELTYGSSRRRDSRFTFDDVTRCDRQSELGNWPLFFSDGAIFHNRGLFTETKPFKMAENRPSHLLHSPITPIKFNRALKEIPSSVTPSNKPSRLGSVRDSDDKSPQKVIIRNSMKSSFLRTGNALRSVHKSSKDVSNTHTENKSLPDDRSSTYIPNSPSSVSVSSDSSLSTITREFDKVKVKSPSIARVNWDTSDDEQDIKSKQSKSTIDVNNHSPLPQRTRTNNTLKRKKPPSIKRYIESDESDSSEREDVSNNSPANRKISKVIIKRPRSHSVNNDKADISEHLLNSDLEHKVDKLQASFPHAPRSDIVRALLRANGAQVKAASELIMNQYLKPSSVKSSTGGKASSAQNLSDRPPEVKKAQRVAPVIVRAEPEQPRAGTNIRVTPRVSNVLSTSSKKQRKSVIMISDESEEEAMTSDDESSDRQYDVDFAPDIEQVKLDIKVVEFFNTSSCQDIQDVTACSIEQAETLISELRPFEDMEDLQEKLRNTKGLGERLITAYNDMMQGYSAVDKLVTDIEHIGKELGEIVSVWKKKEANQDAMSEASGELDMSAMEGYLHQQPETMSNEIVLKGYQIFGVNWMLLLYRRKLSGILADEMGLGKTAQVIGFIAQLVSEGKVGPHLIIVPSSTLENWLREFEKFCPSLDVRSYYGTQSERRAIRYDLREDRSWPVLVTTYQMATGTEIDRKFLKKFNFDVTVLDEGHMVKNCTSARYHHLMSIPSSFRLLLTGTPLQNNLQELVSLLTFILPKMFTENEEELKKIFKIKYTSSTIKDRDASNASESKAPAGSTNIAQMLSMQRIKRAKKMMTPFVLRRQKSQVYNDLPKKHHMIKRCPMSERQLQVYTKVVDDSKKSWITPEINGDASTITSNSGTENAPAIKPAKTANILMELRKAAIHPMLLRSMYTDEIIGKMAKSIMRVSVSYVQILCSFMIAYHNLHHLTGRAILEL